MKKFEDSRMTVLAYLWMQHGCPEKMTIHVKKTRETIVLMNGMPLEPEVKTTDTPCAECGRPLPVGRSRFCSEKCGSRSREKTRKQKRIQRAGEAMKIFSPERDNLPPTL